MSYKPRTGNFIWIIINRYGNYWDGKTFIKYPDNCKEYKCHGKAVLAIPKAKASINSKEDKCYVELKKITIDEQQEHVVESFADWLAKTPL